MADERSPHLVLLDDSAEVFELPEGRTRIGRAPGNEMRLEDKTVSRFHCHVIRSGREVRVEDADSHNSTRVNGQHATETPLQDGDVLRVGRLKLRYHDPEKVVARPAVKRDRYAARRRRPTLFPLLFFLIAVLALSWLYIASSFTARRSPNESALASRDDRGLTSELLETQRQLRMQNVRLEDVKSRFSGAQASMNALEKNYQRELAALRLEYEDGKGVAKDKALYRQMVSLESTIRELQEQREADRELFKKQLEEATQEMAASGSRIGAGSNRSLTGRTGVSSLQPRSALSKKEVAGLAENLRRALENYASVEATPETLEPDLSTLSMAGGGEAAKGLLGVLGHAGDLLKGIDDNMAFLKRITDKRLADAAVAGGSKSEGSNKKKEGSSYKAGPALEKLQRELELSDRKLAIKKTQRERLVELVDAVKAAFGRVTDPGAVRYLLGAFARDRDVETRLAILNSLRASSSPDAIPVLLKRFTAQDETVREAVREALIVITGKDLGGSKKDWERWWAEQKL